MTHRAVSLIGLLALWLAQSLFLRPRSCSCNGRAPRSLSLAKGYLLPSQRSRAAALAGALVDTKPQQHAKRIIAHQRDWGQQEDVRSLPNQPLLWTG